METTKCNPISESKNDGPGRGRMESEIEGWKPESMLESEILGGIRNRGDGIRYQGWNPKSKAESEIEGWNAKSVVGNPNCVPNNGTNCPPKFEKVKNYLVSQTVLS